MMKQKGQFISVEGIEGAGKSTAMAFIETYLQKKSIPAHFTREPGGTPIAEAIRQLLLRIDIGETMESTTELLLMFASRAQHLATGIKPRLAKGEWVVTDRFIDASYAYQAAGRLIPASFIQQLDKEIVGNCYPNLTLLLDIDPQIGLKRAASHHEKDRIESEKIEFFERVRTGYLIRQRTHADRIKLIDASKPLIDVTNQIENILNQFMMRVT